MKEIVVRLTLTVRVDVPDNHPLTAERLQSAISWKANDWCDGRLPFSSEMAMVGAERTVLNGVEEALFQSYAKVPMFCGPEGMPRLDARNALVERRAAEARVHVLATGFEVLATEEKP